jgi:hypothetical protein
MCDALTPTTPIIRKRPATGGEPYEIDDRAGVEGERGAHRLMPDPIHGANRTDGFIGVWRARDLSEKWVVVGYADG